MIELKAGKKSYPDGEKQITILNQIDLQILQGEFVSIMGRSGSGKSTLLHVLGGMDRLTDGKYEFNGSSVKEMKDSELADFRGKHFGFVFQSFYLIREFTALQNIEVPMGYAGIPRKERKERAFELLRQVGLESKSRHYPNQLSGGQQQRIAIARAMANKPDVIFADEPTGSLDRENGDSIVELLLQLHRNGTTLVLVTHDSDLGDLAQTKIILENGQISKE